MEKLRFLLICFIALGVILSCGGGGGGAASFSSESTLHNSGGSGGWGTGNQTGGGLGGTSIEEDNAGLLLGQKAAIAVTKVDIDLVVNGVHFNIPNVDETTTTAVLPPISIGDEVSGTAVLYLQDNTQRTATLEMTSIGLHNDLKFIVPYYYTANNFSGAQVALGVYFARDGINLAAYTDDTIAGWSCREDGSVHYGSYVTGIRGDITLDPVQQAGAGTYSITYVSDKQTVAGETYNVSAAHTLPSPTVPGYRFDGWFENQSFSGSVVLSIPAGSTGNKTFYAKWTAVNYTVNFRKPLGVDATISPTNDTYTIETGLVSVANVTCTTANFIGWYTNSSYSGNAVTAIPVGETEDKILYGKFEATITFNLQGGNSVAPLTQTCICGLLASRPVDPTKSNCSFGGWYTNSSCTTAFDFATDRITKNITLYAKWNTPSVSVSVTSGDSTSLIFGESVVLSATPTNFPGTPTYIWNISPSGASAITTNTFIGATATIKSLVGKSGTATVSVTATYGSGADILTATSPNLNIIVNDKVSATNIAEYLAEFAINAVGTPLNITVANVTNSNLSDVAATIGASGKYVNLTLDASNDLTRINFGWSPDSMVAKTTYLVGITIPEGVTELNYQAFQPSELSSNLKSVTLPASLTTIKAQAFTNCTSITTVIVNGTNNWDIYIDDGTFESNVGALNSSNIILYGTHKEYHRVP